MNTRPYNDKQTRFVHAITALGITAFLQVMFLLLLEWGNLSAQSPLRYPAPVREADDTPIAVYKQRRNALMATISNRSIAVVFSADTRNRQNDVEYEYRQSSDMLYLCGFPEKESLLLLVPGGMTFDSAPNAKRYEHILFVSPKNPQRELWTGVQYGAEQAHKTFGLDTVLHSTDVQSTLKRIALLRDTLYYGTIPTATAKEPMFGSAVQFDQSMRSNLREAFADLTVKSISPTISRMREIKDADELRLLKKTIEISCAGHRAVMQSAKPGMFEYEAEAVMESTFRTLGAEDVGYGSIVGAGVNSCILHYTSNRAQMKRGDVLLMDCGAEYHGYTADITRTIPVNGVFSKEQRIIYDIVLEAQDSSIAMCRAGVNRNAGHTRAVNVIRRRLLELGIIQKPEEYVWYFPHGSAHNIGFDVHDRHIRTVFEPNMVTTVEPGIYIPEGSPCDKRWWNIGIRIEDDILVTNGDPVILSGGLPRKADDIEKLMKARKK